MESPPFESPRRLSSMSLTCVCPKRLRLRTRSDGLTWQPQPLNLSYDLHPLRRGLFTSEACERHYSITLSHAKQVVAGFSA